jgi:N-methylhydantoinase A
MGQTFEIEVPLGEEELTTDAAQALAEGFPQRYEAAYGRGTAWEGSPVMLVNVNLTVTAERPVPALRPVTVDGAAVGEAEKERREILLPGGERGEVPVYDGPRVAAGAWVSGPAIVDEHDTTLVVPPGWTCRRDEYLNYVMERDSR